MGIIARLTGPGQTFVSNNVFDQALSIPLDSPDSSVTSVRNVHPFITGDNLAAAQIPRIAFVSCNPVTFARDAKTLIQAGYRLDWVQVVDQFRWSAHVELAASFTLSHMAND